MFKYTTLKWVTFWGVVVIMLACLSEWLKGQTYLFVVITFIILILGIVIGWIRWGARKCSLWGLDCHFLIPKNKYPLKSFDGAPTSERLIKNLCVGIGTYTLLLEIKAKTNFQFDPIDIVFEGNGLNRPRLIGKDNPYIVEILPNGSMRNWWGNIISTTNEYPRYLYKGYTLIDGNRIKTAGEWKGKIRIQIPVREMIITKRLGFEVSKTRDDSLFLKTTSVCIEAGAVVNTSPPFP